MSDPTSTPQPNTTKPIEAWIDENKHIALRRSKHDFKGRHFEAALILQAWPDRDFGPGSVRLLHDGWPG